MHYRNQYNYLFRQNDLSYFLRARFASLETEIKGWSLEKINSRGEQNLINELLAEYTLHAPSLKEDEINVDVHEAEIEVSDSRVFHDERPYKTVGLKIFVRLPFEGDADLFHCKASTYSISGTPEADIEGQTIVLHYETVEKEPEKIKNLWKNDIKDIKRNLEWIGKDLANFNESLEDSTKNLVLKRKREAEENQHLIDKIKS